MWYNLYIYTHTHTHTPTHICIYMYIWASLMPQMIKNLPAMRETWVWSLGWEDPIQKRTATHSSILVWRIPWTAKVGRLRSMGLQRVGHNWVTFTDHWYVYVYMYAYIFWLNWGFIWDKAFLCFLPNIQFRSQRSTNKGTFGTSKF